MKKLLLIGLILGLYETASSVQQYTHYFCKKQNRLYKLNQNDINQFKIGIKFDSMEFCQVLEKRHSKNTLIQGPAIILQGKKLNE